MQMQGIAENLAALNEDVTVFTANAINGEAFGHSNKDHDIPFKTEEVLNGVKIHRFPLRYSIYNQIFGRILRLKGGNWFMKLLSDDSYNMLRSGPFIPDMVLGIKRAKPDVLIAYSAYYATSYFSYLAKKYFHIPFVLMPSLRMDKGWQDSAIVNKIIASADLLIAFTEYEKTLLCEKGIEETKIRVIGNAIDPDPFVNADDSDFRKKYKLTDDPVVLFLGRFAKGKGLDHLLDAIRIVWKQNPKIQLVLAGRKQDMEVEMSKRLSAMTQAQRNRVVIIDEFPAQERVSFYHGCDLFVMPSEIDSFGLVYLEAWACGKPVIACKDTAPASYINEGKDGLLVEYGNINEIALNITSLLANKDLCKQMGQNGKKKVLSQYSWDVVVHSIRNELYKMTHDRKIGE